MAYSRGPSFDMYDDDNDARTRKLTSLPNRNIVKMISEDRTLNQIKPPEKKLRKARVKFERRGSTGNMGFSYDILEELNTNLCLQTQFPCRPWSSGQDAPGSQDIYDVIRCISAVITSHIDDSASDKYVAKESYGIFNLGSMCDTVNAQRTPRPRPEVTDNKVLESVVSFVETVHAESLMEFEVIVISLIYLERIPLLTNDEFRINEANWKGVLFTCMVIASKMWDDFAMCNGDFADIFDQLRTSHLNDMEVILFTILGNSLTVSTSEYTKYLSQLNALQTEVKVRRHQVEVESMGGRGKSTSKAKNYFAFSPRANSRVLPSDTDGDSSEGFEHTEGFDAMDGEDSMSSGEWKQHFAGGADGDAISSSSSSVSHLLKLPSLNPLPVLGPLRKKPSAKAPSPPHRQASLGSTTSVESGAMDSSPEKQAPRPGMPKKSKSKKGLLRRIGSSFRKAWQTTSMRSSNWNSQSSLNVNDSDNEDEFPNEGSDMFYDKVSGQISNIIRTDTAPMQAVSYSYSIDLGNHGGVSSHHETDIWLGGHEDVSAEDVMAF